MRSRSLSVSMIYGAAMLTLYGGERVMGAGGARVLLTLVGLLLLGLAILLRGLRVRAQEGERRTVERILLWLQLVGAFAVLLYFLQSDVMTHLGGRSLADRWPRLATILAVLWPAAWVAAIAPTALVEAAYAAVVRAPRLELRRIRDAMYSGLGLAGALVLAFTLAYVTSERDKKVDLSYFRTARPGEATRKIARTLTEPVQVGIFFPPANDVADQVGGYFDDLRRESGQLQVARYDQAIDVTKARELGVSGNGTVVLARGGRREQLFLGLEIQDARTMLRNLDKEVQRRLLQVSRTGRTLYVTTGHGERTFDPAGETDKRATIRALRDFLQDQGYAVRTLGAAEGLATEVPKDASALLVIGPSKPFLAEEVLALSRFLDRGGRLMVALDPEAGLDQHELTTLLGLDFKPVTLANDVIYGRRSNQKSDRANIVTGSFSSHPSVTTLGRLRAPVAFGGAGWLEDRKDKPKEVTIDYTVRAHTSTWNDANGNWEFDAPAETRKAWQLVAAVRKKPPDGKGEEARVIVLADSDALSDALIAHPQLGNALILLDGVKWMVGDEAITGETQSEADAPIVHTRKQDVAWFYSTVFVAPALVLGLGFLITRRRKSGGKAERPQGTAAAASPGRTA
ncbi:MAG TPA: DUF4350 domain-containing protein [Polyangia bacterium]|nr:DUF4350 domain-containing protein [Polyangia bacterium]